MSAQLRTLLFNILPAALRQVHKRVMVDLEFEFPSVEEDIKLLDSPCDCLALVLDCGIAPLRIRQLAACVCDREFFSTYALH